MHAVRISTFLGGLKFSEKKIPKFSEIYFQNFSLSIGFLTENLGNFDRKGSAQCHCLSLLIILFFYIYI